MPDISFIYPPLSVSERYGNRKVGNAGGHLPPLGIAGLAAYLRENGFSVEVLDALVLEMTASDVVSHAAKQKPSVVAFSALTSNFHRAVATAKMLRKRFPGLLILIGGHHATIMPLDVMRQNRCFDLLFYGEGENSLLQLMNLFKGGGFSRAKLVKDTAALGKIKGIVYRNGKKAVQTAPAEPIQNLDSLPFPARDLLPMEKYVPLPNQYLRKPVVHMLAIRGCPYNCTFCSNNAVFGRKIRWKSPKRIVGEIEDVKQKYGAREISFWDDMMTVSRKWMLEFCELLMKRNVGITWTCYARVNTVDPEMLRTMKKAGCWNIFYGYEAGDQALLDNIQKGITLQQIRDANRWTKDAGIEVRGSFMLALPGETPELARKTMDFACELNPDYAQFSITTPYPGTKLWHDAKKWGRLYKTDFSKYQGWDVVFVPWGYKSKEEVYAIEREAFRRFYFRPRYILGRIAKIRSLEDVMRYAKGFRFLLGFSS